MSEMDLAKMMFGWANESTPMLGWSSSSSASSNVRYGTVIAANEDGTYQVQLDTGEVITMESETPLKVGDRVNIVNQNGSWILYGMATFVDNMKNETVELAKKIEEKGKEISQGVLDALEEFEKEHGIEDMDVSKTIEELEHSITTTFVGEITEDGVKYKTLTQLTQDVNGLESRAETYFSDDEEGIAKLQSTIEQHPEIIQSTVQTEVENVAGETYVTKTEFTQTSNSLSASVSGAVNTANSASEKAEDAENFIETHFTADTSGLTIESSASSYKSRVTPSSFDILSSEDAMVASMSAIYSGVELRGGSSDYPYLWLNSRGACMGATNSESASSVNQVNCWNTGNGLTLLSNERINAQVTGGDIELYAYSGDIVFRVGNSTSSYTEWSPYCKDGTTLGISSVDLRTAGFVTGSSATIYFTIPLVKPVISGTNSSVSMSVTGVALRLRQSGSYTHGSSSSVTVSPSSATAAYIPGVGVKITCTMSSTTNAVNNAPIGIEFTGTLYF